MTAAHSQVQVCEHVLITYAHVLKPTCYTFSCNIEQLTINIALVASTPTVPDIILVIKLTIMHHITPHSLKMAPRKEYRPGIEIAVIFWQSAKSWHSLPSHGSVKCLTKILKKSRSPWTCHFKGGACPQKVWWGRVPQLCKTLWATSLVMVRSAGLLHPPDARLLFYVSQSGLISRSCCDSHESHFHLVEWGLIISSDDYPENGEWLIGFVSHEPFSEYWSVP